jgi:hypothetical protein
VVLMRGTNAALDANDPVVAVAELVNAAAVP